MMSWILAWDAPWHAKLALSTSLAVLGVIVGMKIRDWFER